MTKNPFLSNITKAFNRAINSYDDDSEIQISIAHKLLEQLKVIIPKQESYKYAADLGCGTGISSRLLIESIAIKHCFAVDIASGLLKKARQSLKNQIYFIEADFNSHWVKLNKLNLIFANMSLQWTNHWNSTLNHIHQQLDTQGLFAFSVPLFESFNALKPEYCLNFISAEELFSLLNQCDFDLKCFECVEYIQKYNTPYAALKSLKQVGANTHFYKQPRSSGLLTPHKLKFYFRHQNFDLNYVIGIIIAQKRESSP